MEKPIFVTLPKPYGVVKINSEYTQTDIKGKWLADAKLVNWYEIKQFAGDKPPDFEIKSDLFNSDNKPLVIVHFFDGKSKADDHDGFLNFENGHWIWRSSFINKRLKNARYKIDIKIYAMGMATNSRGIAEFSCIWYPSLSIETIPATMIWPDEKCEVKIKLAKNLPVDSTIYTDIDDNYPVLKEKVKNEIVWTFTKKPPDCIPIIAIKIDRKLYEFPIKLPYISIWVQTKLQQNTINPAELEWSNNKPFSRCILEELVKKDYEARIRFRYWGKKGESISLFESSTDKLIRRLSFEKNGHASISCGEILQYLKYDNLIIKDEVTHRKSFLFEKDDEAWDSMSIYNSAKKIFLYKNFSYFPGTSK